MASPHDICIRGAGIVGRALALHLAQARLRVALVQAAPAPNAAADVRAYSLNSASRAVLDGVRCWPAEEWATPVTRMSVYGDNGGHIEFDASSQSLDALTWMVDVPVLESQLADAVRFQPLIDVVAEPVPAKLTVVCEGRASRTRDEFGVAFNVTAYPQHAVATRLLCDQPHQGTAYQWFDGDDILAFLPLGGRAGHEVAVVWSRPAAVAQQTLAMDPTEFEAAIQRASRAALGSVKLNGPRASWPLQLAEAARWVGTLPDGSAWALAGDAAHNVHPLSGQGLNLGLGDVADLVRILQARDYWRSPGDMKLLRTYERARKAALLPTALSTDGLQRLFGLSGEPWQTLRNRGMMGVNQLTPLKTLLTRQAMGRPLFERPPTQKA